MLDGYGYYRTAEPTVTVFFAYFVFVAGLHDCFITSVDFWIPSQLILQKKYQTQNSQSEMMCFADTNISKWLSHFWGSYENPYATIGGVYLSACRVSRGLLGGI